MLDQATKRKLDSARQILVGKVPDPKAQVEQITTALIYKFMDDMDKENEEVGLKAQFFVDDWKKFSWTKILDNKLSGQDRLDLYVQAITNMPKNPHIPQLFRDIFKGAFLPYNDPRTLSLFLKEINEFNYEHSENLGNAFEYLLSILGSQGDAGQFRTPRHIIDFIVEVISPKKNETILDPACGTAGFLISAYKYILKQNKEKALTPDEKLKLMNNLAGYDISPDMVKLALVNMYLHGFPEPKIHEYDTLSSEKRWDETFDVIMANPPFMTPKGGIVPHKRFSIQANRAEVLFVDYIVEHLTIKGRAGIIVPEGVIFKNEAPYKQLRKTLIEDGLFAVVSLPAGVFNPYSPVKTNILFFDNVLAKKTDKILFIRVLNDGFDLGAQRREVDRNDLVRPDNEVDATKVLKGQRIAIETGTKNPWLQENSIFAYEITKEQIAQNGGYNLSAERYRLGNLGEKKNIKYPMVELGEVLDYEQPTKYIVNSVDYDDKYKTPVLTAGKTFVLGYTNEKNGIFQEKLPVIIFDDFTTATKFVDFPFKVKSSAMKILHADKTRVNIKFLFRAMQRIVFPINEHKRYWISEYSKIKIPLPPIEVQNEIVEQIEVKQNAIDHAKAIIQNLERERRYFGQSLRKLEGVEIMKLSDVCEINRKTAEPTKLFGKDAFAYIDISSVENGTGNLNYENMILSSKAPSRARRIIQNGDVLLSTVRPNLKAFAYLENLPSKALASTGFAVLTAKENVSAKYVFHLLFADDLQDQMTGRMGKGSYPSINQDDVEQLSIPFPSLAIQKKLVAEAEKEQQTINANKQLIEIYEQKISDVLSEI